MARIEAIGGTEALKLMSKMDAELRGPTNELSLGAVGKLIEFAEQLAMVLTEVRDAQVRA